MSDKFYLVNKDLMKNKHLGLAEKMVFSAIADHIGMNSKAWVGQRTLATELNLSKPTIIKAIIELEQAGLLLIERRKTGQSNWYRLTKSGQETLPVYKKKSGQETLLGGKETLPEAVKKLDRNYIPNNYSADSKKEIEETKRLLQEHKRNTKGNSHAKDC